MEAASACVDKDRVVMANYAIAGKSHPDQKLTLLKTTAHPSANGNHVSDAPGGPLDDALHSGTFCIWEEDHTLGNALRHYIMKK
jgi:RNA polymerase Rpb3/Rpb11 dimerisation domain